MELSDAIKSDLFLRMVTQGLVKDTEAVDVFELLSKTYPDNFDEKVSEWVYLTTYGYNPQEATESLNSFIQKMSAFDKNWMDKYYGWREHFMTFDISHVRSTYADWQIIMKERDETLDECISIRSAVSLGEIPYAEGLAKIHSLLRQLSPRLADGDVKVFGHDTMCHKGWVFIHIDFDGSWGFWYMLGKE